MADLWREAAGFLSTSERDRLDSLLKGKSTRLEDVISLVQHQRQRSLDRRLKVTKLSGKVVYVRDILDNIAHWLDKFKQVGDVAIQADPIHSALPWAAVRFLLQTAVNDSEKRLSVLEGVEVVTREASRCSAIEVSLLSHKENMTDLRSKLRSSLIGFYYSVFSYMIEVANHYATSTTRRVVNSVTHGASNLDEKLKAVRASTTTVSTLVNTNTAELAETNEQHGQQIISFLQSYDNQRALQERSEFLWWISNVPYWEHHEKSVSELAPGSGSWLQQKLEYQTFMRSPDSSTFWLRSNLGYGKSKVMSACIEAILDDTGKAKRSAAVAYFYVSRQEEGASDTVSILRALVRQLVLECPGISSELEQIYHARKTEAMQKGVGTAALSFDECVKQLLRAAMDKPLVMFIDGLDQMDEEDVRILRVLQQVADNAENSIKMVIASRPIPSIGFSQDALEVYDIQPSDCIDDISRYLHFAVSKAIKDRKLLKGNVTDHLQAGIVQSLLTRADGMFLWAELQLKNLCAMKRSEDIIASFEKPAKNMAITYDAMYSKFNQFERGAISILQITFVSLLAAQRPLQANELLSIVSVDPHTATYRSVTADELLDVCGNFVILNRQSSRFDFFHLSAREYFEARPEFSDSVIHELMFRRCMAHYMPAPEGDTSSISDDGVTDATAIIDATEIQEILQSYVAMYWPIHYTKIIQEPETSEARPILLRFALKERGLFEMWLFDVEILVNDPNEWDELRQRLREVLSSDNSPIFAACAFDLDALLDKLLGGLDNPSKARKVEATNLNGATPLYLSARNGKIKTLKRLLLSGATVNSKSGYFGDPMQAAAFFGYCEAVGLLLDHGADPNQVGKFKNAFHAAFAGGQEEIARIM